MLGNFSPAPTPVNIVGGGFAGLALALKLSKQDRAVTVYEASDRFGGLIRTDNLNGTLSEAAANSLLVNETVLDFCNELGLELLKLDSAAHARYIYRGGKLRKVPLSFLEICQLIIKLTTARSKVGITTIEEWTKCHLGDAALKYLVTPGLTGIYAAKPAELGVAAIIPKLQVAPGSTLLGQLLRNRKERQKRKFRSFMAIPNGGMEALIEAMVQVLRTRPNVTLKNNSPITAIDSNQNGDWALCTPAYITAQLLQASCPQSAHALAQVRYASLVSVTIKATKAQFKHTPQGTGVLVPLCEQRPTLGILFCSSSFPSIAASSDEVVLRLMLGGTHKPEAVTYSDSTIKQLVEEELVHLFGYRRSDTDLVRIYRWPLAIPIYSPDLVQLWQQMPWCTQPGKVLFGNYTGKVSLRGMLETLREMFP